MQASRIEPVPALKTYLVEDSPVIRDNLIATLEEMAPVQVVGCAEDERSARLWLDDPAHVCDLVIVDVFLRQGSGLGLLQALQATGRACKRVVLSNYATPDLRRRCLALGADAVFDKSTDIEALLDWCAGSAAAAP